MASTVTVPSLSEKDWQWTIVDYARHNGWREYHTLRSQGSTSGWPDLVLVRDDELLIVEVKTQKGRVSPAQREWLDALARVASALMDHVERLAFETGGAHDLSSSPRIEVHLWRPADWPGIQQRLARTWSVAT